MSFELLAMALALTTIEVGDGPSVGDPATPVTPAMISAGYISDSDYPAAARNAGEEGTVRMRFLIAPSGKVAECQIASSSGSAALDEKSCAIWTHRMRYKPARDATGAKVPQWLEQSIGWGITAKCSVPPDGICVTARN